MITIRAVTARLIPLVACLATVPACSRQSEPPAPPLTSTSAATPARPPSPVAAASDAEQVPLQTQTQQLDDGTRQRARAIDDQRRDLKRAKVSFEATSVEELTPEQRQLLEDRIAHERGSRKNLLQEI